MPMNSRDKGSTGERELKGEWFSCEYCGEKFFVRQCDINYRKIIKYCSRDCYHKASRKTHILKCPNCEREFQAKNKRRKFCCLRCAYEYRRKQEPKITTGKDGYRHIWLSDGTSIKEHRYIMEKHLGRKLNGDEHIHHKDFSRDNNAIENLIILTKGEHSRIHRMHEIEQGKGLFGRNDE